jgi:tetratricopeptide (TPR) repeat protein
VKPLGYFITAALIVPAPAVAAATAAEPGSRQRTFVRALEVFDAAKTPGEYRGSAALLESLLADGFRSGAVYYNLGNAYFRAGEYGRSIAAYRKAKLYRPRDPYLEANLRQALAVAPGHLPEPPVPWWRHVLFWSGWLSFPEKAYAAFSACLLGALAAGAALLLRRPSGYWMGGALVLVAASLGLDAALDEAGLVRSRYGVVTGETIARKGIGKDYEPAFDRPVKDGAEFTVLSESGEWVLGHFEGIGDGWIRRDHTDR